MARVKPYDLDQRKMIPVALEAQILPGSFEHTLMRLIDQELDLRAFDAKYNHVQRHTGPKGFTSQEVFQGRRHALARQRQHVLDAAYAANPQRWIDAPPKAPLAPEVVAINPAQTVDTDSSSPLANELVPAQVPIITTEINEVIGA